MANPDPTSPGASREVTHDRSQIDRLVREVLDLMTGFSYPEPSRFAVRLALEEAISNAFRHGHRALPAQTPVVVEYRVDPDNLELVVTDQGPGFNPADVPDPTLEENLENPSGRGLVLIRAYMSEVEVLGCGNRLRMVYRRPRPVPGTP